jgi:hypothetical protein
MKVNGGQQSDMTSDGQAHSTMTDGFMRNTRQDKGNGCDCSKCTVTADE